MDRGILIEGIADLERSETNVRNVRDLAALYIVLDHYKPEDIIEKELDDIFPCYTSYVKIKTKYQGNVATKQELISAMSNLCIEIREFIETLYKHCEIVEERGKIHEFVTNLQSVIY